MKLSTKGKYALYAMYYLAQHSDEGPQPLCRIAEVVLPETYLEQLLSTLRKAGLVRTVRGAQGGYLLAKPPGEITVGDIIDATEGPVSMAECVDNEESCAHCGQCKTRRVWEYLGKNINALLQSISLQDMLEKENF